MLKHYSNYWLLLALLATIPFNCFAQDEKEIDSITILLHKAEKAGNDTLIALKLGAIAKRQRTDDPDLAFKTSLRQLAISKKAQYELGMADAYSLQGIVYDHKGEYDKAIECLLLSLSLFEELGRETHIVDVNNNIGVIYSKKGIYSEALKYLLKGLDVATKAKDDLGIISTYNNIGLIYEDQKNHDEALKYYLKCLKIQQKLGKGYYVQTTLLNIGSLYLVKKQPETALEYYNNGIQYSIEENDDASLANNYSGVGDVYISKKEWDKALENHFKAFEIRKRMDDGFGLLNSYVALGGLYHRKGENKKALDHTLQALQIVKRTGELDFLVKIHQQLAEIYESMGDKSLALENYKLFKTFNDSIFNTENSKKLTEQQMNFDFKLKEEKKEAEAKQALQYQKNIRNYSIAGLFIIAIFIIILLRQRFRVKAIKKQKAHEAAMQKLENEIVIKDIEAQALKVENENSLLKEEKLQQKLEFNERELASATMYLYQKNEMLTGLQKELEDASSSIPEKSVAKMKNAIQNNLYLDADWDKFRIHFEKVHPDFFKNLRVLHPNLTSYEVRLAAYFHIELSPKEIAALLNISPLSVHKAKSRLNKKLSGAKEEQE